MKNTTSSSFFEAKYREDVDPWNFRSSAYEQSRYASIISILAGRKYQRAFEPGCSIGVLTAKLAPLCDELISIDVSPTAVELARQQCASHSHVEIQMGSLPAFMPAGPFDLIVFSEIGYYFEEPELRAIGKLLVNRLARDGVFVAAHWLGQSDDHILGGGRVHQVLSHLDGLRLQQTEPHDGFHLDRWVRS